MTRKNIILISLYFIIFSWLIQANYEYALLVTTTTILIGFLLSSSRKSFDLTVKLLIIALGIFALLVVIQSFIYIINPKVFDIIHNPTVDSGSSRIVVINHSIHYLGFWASGRVYIFGIEMPRFQSFASEPSILVSTFLMPGLVGLTYTGFTRKISYLILFFTIVLSSSGTIYLAVAFGGLSFLSLYVSNFIKSRLVKYLLLSGFVIIIIFIVYMIIFSNVSTLMTGLDINLSSYQDYSSILGSSGHKSEARLISNQQAFQLLFEHPFGIDARNIMTTCNLLLTYGIRLGFFGVLLCGLIFIPIIKKLFTIFFLNNSIVHQISIALIIGTIIEALVFSGYGWMTQSGFIITSILYRRSQDMIKVLPKNIKIPSELSRNMFSEKSVNT